MMNDNSNRRTAVVTGGSRGIGRAVAEALLERGWRVCFFSRRQSSVDRASAELRERWGDAVRGDAVDVTKPQTVADYFARREQEGGVDCLVNNAGVGRFAAVDELDPEGWREVLATNLDGAFYCLAAVAPGMKRRGRGWIFNIASLAGKNAFAGGAAYNASKFGLVGLSEAAMLDLRQHGVRVAAILPGSVATGFTHPRPGSEEKWKLRPEDVARTVVDLMAYPSRALPSLVELRPSQPPGK